MICKYIIRQPEQQKGVGGIEDIKEIFQARPLLPVISEHEGQRNDHHPLGGIACSGIEHFRTELVYAEQAVYNAKPVFLVPQEVHQHTQGDEIKAVFIEDKAGDNPGQGIPAYISGKGDNVRNAIIQALHEEYGDKQKGALFSVPEEQFNCADDDCSQKHREEDVMIAVAVFRYHEIVIQGIAENGHEDAHQVQPQQITLPVFCIMVSPYHAEKEQGIRASSEPPEPKGGGREIISDVVEYHED